MRSLSIIILLSLIVSCGQKLPSKLYKTTDEMTGGFNSFVLDLRPNGKLEMQLLTSKTLSVTENGNIVETPKLIINGNWTLKDKKIIFKINSSRQSIDSFIVNSDFANTFKDKQFLLLSNNQDTAYIFGIPALLTDRKCDNE